MARRGRHRLHSRSQLQLQPRHRPAASSSPKPSSVRGAGMQRARLGTAQHGPAQPGTAPLRHPELHGASAEPPRGGAPFTGPGRSGAEPAVPPGSAVTPRCLHPLHFLPRTLTYKGWRKRSGVKTVFVQRPPPLLPSALVWLALRETAFLWCPLGHTRLQTRDRVLVPVRGPRRDQQPAAVAVGSSSRLQSHRGIMGSEGVQQDVKRNNEMRESQTGLGGRGS